MVFQVGIKSVLKGLLCELDLRWSVTVSTLALNLCRRQRATRYVQTAFSGCLEEKLCCFSHPFEKVLDE